MTALGDLDVFFFSDCDESLCSIILDDIFYFLSTTDSLVTTCHNPDILDILCESFGYTKDILIVKRNNKFEGFIPLIIVSGIGTRVVSMPHFSYGGYLGNKDLSTNQHIDLIEIIKQKYGENVLIRDFKKISNFTLTEKVAHFLKLEDSSGKQFNNFSSKLRSQIRKATKNGLLVEQSSLEDFYPIYINNMHRLGSPHLSKTFFRNLLENYSHGEAVVFSVKYGQKHIGSSILLIFKGFSEVTWASTYKDFNHLAPNMILYWKMIEYCIERKIRIFSFGRASKESGSLRFKKQWGGDEIQLVWNYFKPQNVRIEKVKFLSVIWRLLPRFIVKIFGPIFTKFVY